jgi:hypothetical protein
MERESILENNDVEIKDVENKQGKLKYEKEVVRFNNISIIAISMSIIALILLFTIAFTYQRIGLGISIFSIITLLSITSEIININQTELRLKEIDYELINNELKIRYIRILYKVSFYVFSINITACIFLLPFYYNKTLYDYLNFVPVLITLAIISFYVLRAITHLLLRSNNTYESVERPLVYYSKKYVYLIILFVIITFNCSRWMQILPIFFVEYILLLLLYCGIISFLNLLKTQF